MTSTGANGGGSRGAGVVVGVALVAALTTALVMYQQGVAEIEAQANDKLSALMQVRRAALHEYLVSVREETRFWNKNNVMRSALIDFSEAWAELGPDATETLQRLYIHENPYPLGERDNLEIANDGSRYSAVHARYHYWLRSFLLHRGVYDVFLFDPEGHLVYTSFKELDYATNLLTGPYKDTDLGNAFRVARDHPYPSYVAFFDFAPYGPSHGAPASFFSSPVLGDAGEFLGVVAFQIPSDRINEILQVTVGMGETGETYAVGEDLLMRSDSRFSEESTILETRVDTATARLALEGNTGLQVTPDYRGIPVVSAYGPLRFENVTWAILSEIDVAEVVQPRRRLLGIAVTTGVASALLTAALGLAFVRRRAGAG